MCTEPRLPAPIASTRDSGSRRVWVQWQVRLLLYPRSPASSPPRRSTPDHQWLAERAAAIATPAARPRSPGTSCRARRLTSRTGGARRRRRRPQRRTLWTRSGWAPSIGAPFRSQPPPPQKPNFPSHRNIKYSKWLMHKVLNIDK